MFSKERMCLDNSKYEDEKQHISHTSTFYSNSYFEFNKFYDVVTIIECSIKVKVCIEKIHFENNAQCLYKLHNKGK